MFSRIICSALFLGCLCGCGEKTQPESEAEIFASVERSSLDGVWLVSRFDVPGRSHTESPFSRLEFKGESVILNGEACRYDIDAKADPKTIRIHPPKSAPSEAQAMTGIYRRSEDKLEIHFDGLEGSVRVGDNGKTERTERKIEAKNFDKIVGPLLILYRENGRGMNPDDAKKSLAATKAKAALAGMIEILTKVDTELSGIKNDQQAKYVRILLQSEDANYASHRKAYREAVRDANMTVDQQKNLRGEYETKGNVVISLISLKLTGMKHDRPNQYAEIQKIPFLGNIGKFGPEVRSYWYDLSSNTSNNSFAD